MDMQRELLKIINELDKKEYCDLAKIISTTTIEFLDENTKRKSNKKWYQNLNLFKW